MSKRPPAAFALGLRAEPGLFLTAQFNDGTFSFGDGVFRLETALDVGVG